MQDMNSKPNQKGYFITGTDTDAGKKFVTCALINKFQQEDYSVMAIKPIAAGCELVDGQWVNDDALLMQQMMASRVDYLQINPATLTSAIAPHIAAEEQGLKYTVEQLSNLCKIKRYDTDVTLVEGAGGWLVPLNDNETLADFAQHEQLEVILVVGMKLGCINHALLTVQSILAAGMTLVGWIANSPETEMNKFEQNIESLRTRIKAPLLGVIPHIQATNPIPIASDYVNIDLLN